MTRKILTILATALVAGVLVPSLAGAQYGTTTTTAPPTTTTTVSVAGITVPPTVPPVRLSPVTVPTEVLGIQVGILDDLAAALDDLEANLPDLSDLDSLTPQQQQQVVQQIGSFLQELADFFGGSPAERAAKLAALSSTDPEAQELRERFTTLLSRVVNALVELGEVAGSEIEGLDDQLAAFAEGTHTGPVVVNFSLGGFGGGALVFFVLESDPALLGGAEANEDGEVTFTGEIPEDLEPGTHTLSAVGTDNDGNPVVIVHEFTVKPPDEQAIGLDDAKPTSTLGDDGGSNTWIFILVGMLVAIALVGALTASGRGKKPATHDIPS